MSAETIDAAAPALPPEVSGWGAGARESGSSWQPVDIGPVLHGLLKGEIKPPAHDVGRIEGGSYLLTSGTVSSLHGGPASGKSWCALRICADIITDGCSAFYVDAEDHAQNILTRLLSLGVDHESLLLRFQYIHPDSALSSQDRKTLLQTIEAERPVLVIVDSTGEVMNLDGLDQNSDGDTGAWFNYLPRAIANLGPAVLTLDHLPKEGGSGAPKRGKRGPIGSQRKLAAIDGTAYEQTMKDPFSQTRPGYASITTVKDRLGEYTAGQVVAHLNVAPASRPAPAPGITPLDVTLTADGSQPKKFRPTVYMERVSKAMELDRRPLSVRGIRAATQGRNDRIDAALACLIEEGYVTVQDGPRSVVHTLARPYRQETDPQADTGHDFAPIKDNDPLIPEDEDDPEHAPNGTVSRLCPSYIRGGARGTVTAEARGTVGAHSGTVSDSLFPFLVNTGESGSQEEESSPGHSGAHSNTKDSTVPHKDGAHCNVSKSDAEHSVYCPHGGPVGAPCRACPGGRAVAS